MEELDRQEIIITLKEYKQLLLLVSEVEYYKGQLQLANMALQMYAPKENTIKTKTMGFKPNEEEK